MSRTPEQVVHEYFDYWNSGDFKGLTSLFADDMKWIIKGNSPQSGAFSRDAIASVLVRLPELETEEPFKLHLQTLTTQDDRAAVEFTSTLKFKDGRTYRNEYHFLIWVDEDGKIKEGHEYLCTWTAVHQGIGEDIAALLAQ